MLRLTLIPSIPSYMAARPSTIGPTCSFGTQCKQPDNEMMTRCGPNCSQTIHMACAKYDKCPFHARDPVAKIAALSSMSPAPNTAVFQPLQGKGYQTAVLRHGTIYDALTKPVKTKYGDDAIVVATPKDGNCLPTAMLRGLVNYGHPLSTLIEQQAVSELRVILAAAIENHQWPHEFVAYPQTIAECIHDVRTDTKWCGELAIVSLASVAGVEVQLWRYPADNAQLNVIEPILSPINPGNGSGRLVVHLLQTRHPLPDQPEHGSHWESVIMKPISPTAADDSAHRPTINAAEVKAYTTSAPIMMDKDEHQYSFIQDNNKEPAIVINVGDMVTFSGHGRGKQSHIRYVHQIRRRHGINHPYQLMVCPLPSSGKGIRWSVIGKRLTDVISTRPATIDETNEYKVLMSLYCSTHHSVVDLTTSAPLSPLVKRSRTKTTPFNTPSADTVAAKKPSPKKKVKHTINVNPKMKVKPTKSPPSPIPLPLPVPSSNGKSKKQSCTPIISSPTTINTTVLSPKTLRIKELESKLAIATMTSQHTIPVSHPTTPITTPLTPTHVPQYVDHPMHMQTLTSPSRATFPHHMHMLTYGSQSHPPSVSAFDSMGLLARQHMSDHMRSLHETVEYYRRRNDDLMHFIAKSQL